MEQLTEISNPVLQHLNSATFLRSSEAYNSPGNIFEQGQEQTQGLIANIEDDFDVVRTPEGEEFLLNARLLANSTGEERLAIALLHRLLLMNPSDLEAMVLMRDCLTTIQYLEDAVRFAKVVHRKSMSILSAMALANIMYIQENDRSALEIYLGVIDNSAVSPQHFFEALKNTGNIYTRSGDFEAARKYYDMAFRVDDKSDALEVNYGTLALQKGELEAGVMHFRNAVQMNAENDKAWVGLGLVHRDMGDLRLAWANLERALDINFKNRTAIRVLIEWSVVDGRIARAIPRVQDYLESQFEDAEISYSLAKLLVEACQYTRARVELERVLALDPSYEEALRLIQAVDLQINRQNPQLQAST
jgi:tetratricopeptide (TPR) repeat protein